MSEEKAAAGLAKMREPFADHQINTLPKPKAKDAQKGSCRECGGWHGLPAVHLSYVGHAALTDRLLDADPEWSWEPLAVDESGLPKFDANGGLWIRLTVCGVTRLGYGDAQGKRGGDAVKEAIGDALRNAGMRFGAALDLWHKGDLHDANEQRGEGQEESVVQRPKAQAKSNGNPPQNDPVREAKNALLTLLKEIGVDADEAKAKFEQLGHGDLKVCDDVKAINALGAHYMQLAGRS